MKKIMHVHGLIIRLVAACMWLAAGSCWAQTQSLSGKVCIAGSDNSALATIRIVDQGIGTTSKLDGTYYLEDIMPGQHTVEFSYIGHKTVRQQLTWAGGEAMQLDVAMQEAPIVLTTAFVTPNGEDAAEYILNRVWKNAEQKRARMPAFDAKVSTVLSYRDFDILMIYDYLPRIVRFGIMSLATMTGFKDFVKMLIAHPKLDVATRCNLHYKKKNFKWDGFAMAHSSASLNDSEKKALYKLTKEEDLYELVYGKENELRSKKTHKELKGSYEEDGRMTYVIEGITRDSVRYTMYVADNSWDVLKLEMQHRMILMQVECRQAPGGLFLPVSINRKLKLIDMTAEQARENLKFSEEDQQDLAETIADTKAKPKTGKEKQREEEFIKQMKDFIDRSHEQGLHMEFNQGLNINF